MGLVHMKYLGIAFFILLTCSNSLSAQLEAFNMELLGNWNNTALPLISGQRYNDCWGYVADGREYAIMGSSRRVHFFDITDPTDIVEVASFQAPQNSVLSIWRDFKTFGHYAYGVADQGGSQEGLLVFDLSGLPNTVTLVNQFNTDFARAHNIYIDEQHGRLYVAGSNTVSNGLLIYDLNVTPEAPELIGTPTLVGGYVHDIHVRNHIGYCSHGFGANRGLRVYNFSNPELPIVLGSLTLYIDHGYNHSSWLTEDGTHLAFCDENHNKTVKMANVENPGSMFVTDTFRSALLAPEFTASIAHNPFIKDDYLYVAYYHDGLQVFDISDPENVFKIAYYDTYPEATNYTGFFGAWGTYPFLPSGNIIVSDMLNGLFVVKLADNIFLSSDIISFEGVKNKEGILINWEAEQEEALQHYELQKSRNNVFLSIYQTEPGNSLNGRNAYHFLDKNPEEGVNYYRLKMVAKDGEVTYSSIRAVRWSDPNVKEVRLFPNLLSSGGEIFLEADKEQWLEVSLFSSNGQLLNLQKFKAGPAPQGIPGSTQLPAGHYLWQCRDEQGKVYGFQSIIR